MDQTQQHQAPPARALHTDPNYKQKEALYAEGKTDAEVRKREEEKGAWEKVKEGAEELGNRMAAAIAPLEHRVNQATSEANRTIGQTGEKMNQSVRDYERKKEHDRQQQDVPHQI